MKMHAPQFQDFEAVNPAEDQTALHTADFDAGFEEGVAEGRRLAVKEDALLTSAAAQSLVDMQFGYAEARAHFVALLEPLFKEMVTNLLPEIAQESLPAKVAAALQSVALRDVSAPVEIAVHPDNVAALSRLIARESGPPIQIKAAPDLALTQAQLCTPTGGGTHLDINHVVTEMSAALAALFDPENQRIA